VAARGDGRSASPMNTLLNCTIPALVNRRVGSSSGTNELLGRCRWPWRSKYRMKLERMSLAFICIRSFA
jgi:hypothetical protein